MSVDEPHGLFDHVVVGIDSYGVAVQLAPVVAALAPDATKTLVNVFPASGEGPLSNGELTLREQAMALLASERVNGGIPDAQVLAVPEHSPARGLRRAAAELGADLLVIGPSALSPVGRIVLGRVGRDVFHGASCPVLVVPAHARPAWDTPRIIGVAFDGSPESVHALQLAAAIAAPMGSRLEVIEALDLDAGRAFEGERRADYARGVHRVEQGRLLRAIAEIADEARGEVVLGEVEQVLGDFAGRVDLLVCGSRGWGPAARVAFGSVADALIRDARCPVLVAPRGARLPDVGTLHDLGDTHA